VAEIFGTYKVIKLGYYPPVSKFTCKISYQIPDNYEVKTNLDICNKPNPHISEIFLFRFDIGCLYKARMETSNHGKYPYTELKSNSQKQNELS
ncbi:45173_t:CDS:2, partial [Gigaspora margarita]